MATRGKRPRSLAVDPAPAKSYVHTGEMALMRLDAGTQAQFKKRKEPSRYSNDHPIPLLQWDFENAAREQGEALIREILEAGSLEDAKEAAERLKRMSQPFLEWTGKHRPKDHDGAGEPIYHAGGSGPAGVDGITGGGRRRAGRAREFEARAGGRRALCRIGSADGWKGVWTKSAEVGGPL